MKHLCQIYKSPKKEEMYLYVPRERGLEDVPEALLASFGEPVEVMSLVLSADKKLARADVNEVMEALEEQGYYLQMPPTPAELLRRDRADD